MSELDQLRQEAEQLKSQIRVSTLDYVALELFETLLNLPFVGGPQKCQRHNTCIRCSEPRPYWSYSDAYP